MDRAEGPIYVERAFSPFKKDVRLGVARSYLWPLASSAATRVSRFVGFIPAGRQLVSYSIQRHVRIGRVPEVKLTRYDAETETTRAYPASSGVRCRPFMP